MNRERTVAGGQSAQRDLTLLGATFDRLWPAESAALFGELLTAIDEAEEEARRKARRKA